MGLSFVLCLVILYAVCKWCKSSSVRLVVRWYYILGVQLKLQGDVLKIKFSLRITGLAWDLKSFAQLL